MSITPSHPGLDGFHPRILAQLTKNGLKTEINLMTTVLCLLNANKKEKFNARMIQTLNPISLQRWASNGNKTPRAKFFAESFKVLVKNMFEKYQFK